MDPLNASELLAALALILSRKHPESHAARRYVARELAALEARRKRMQKISAFAASECPAVSGPIPDTAAFCRGCGAAFDPVPPAPGRARPTYCPRCRED